MENDGNQVREVRILERQIYSVIYLESVVIPQL